MSSRFDAGRPERPMSSTTGQEVRRASDKNLRQMLATSELINEYNSDAMLEENATNLVRRLSRKEQMKASVTQEPVAGKPYLAAQRAVFGNRGVTTNVHRLKHTGTVLTTVT